MYELLENHTAQNFRAFREITTEQLSNWKRVDSITNFAYERKFTPYKILPSAICTARDEYAQKCFQSSKYQLYIPLKPSTLSTYINIKGNKLPERFPRGALTLMCSYFQLNNAGTHQGVTREQDLRTWLGSPKDSGLHVGSLKILRIKTPTYIGSLIVNHLSNN